MLASSLTRFVTRNSNPRLLIQQGSNLCQVGHYSSRIFNQKNYQNKKPSTSNANPSPKPSTNPKPAAPKSDRKPTLESVITMKSVSSESPVEDVDADILTEESQEELKKKERVQRKLLEDEKKRHRKVLKGFGLSVVLASILGFFYLGQPDENDTESTDESWLGGYYRRFKKNTFSWYSTAAAPVYGEKLLPDPLPEQYQRPLTLVIEVNDALVHLVWDKEVGWRVAARPYVKDLLGYLGRYYEIVFFSSSPAMTVQPVVDALDPYQQVMYKLYRESTRFVGNKMIKDLSALNRDLGKVICVDIDPDAYSLQPENGVLLKKWTGEKGDREIPRLISFLEELALFATVSEAKDIRPILAMLNNVEGAKDAMEAWVINKEKVKQQFKQAQDSPTRGFSLLSKQAAPQKSLFEMIEYYAKEERNNYEKDKEAQMQQMKEMRRQAELEQKKMLEEMKSKNMKMFDYIFNPPQPPQPGQQK